MRVVSFLILNRDGKFGGKINVLVVGSGGREHALAWKIRQSPLVGELFVAPGNGGIQEISIPINATDIPGLIEFARRKRCFTIVGPEIPLGLGIVDRFLENDLAIFGPSQEQAKLETSKCYSKELMKKNNIPTAEFETFSEPEKAADYASRYSGNVVVKADGLAAGKGVFVCSNMSEAEKAINLIMVERVFGDSGNLVVVEEKLAGREVSLMTLCNGKEYAIPFGTASDHKRLLDNNMGPNTGGMGAYSPSLDFDSNRINEVMQKVISPTIATTGFSGFLYAGLMVNGPDLKVLEFNARLGDPETQVILPRLESDLFKLILSAYEGKENNWEWNNSFSCCVAMCSKGYPSDPITGDEISGLKALDDPSTFVFHAGTKKIDQKLLTAGGRVLYVTSLGPTLEVASNRAYETVKTISWAGEYHRADIGRQPVTNRIHHL